MKRDGWSVYRIRFADGAAYVGMTKLTVIDRLYRHLDGEGGAGIRPRYRAGMGYRFDVLASGLAEHEARGTRRRAGAKCCLSLDDA